MFDWSKCDIVQLMNERDAYARITCHKLLSGQDDASLYLNEFAAIDKELQRRLELPKPAAAPAHDDVDVNGDDATTRYEQEPGA